MTVLIVILFQLTGTAAVYALGARSKLRLAQLRLDNSPIPRPSALGRLAWEIDKRTSIDVDLEVRTIQISDRRLFRYPLLYLSGQTAFAPLREAAVARLRQHLLFGGQLLIDSADPRRDGPFHRSVSRLVKRLFAGRELSPVDSKHVIHRSYYLLPRALGRVAAFERLQGIGRDGRLLVVYSQNDLGGAWARDNFGRWEYSVHPGGDRQREMAFRWGINWVMYALCLDYKADQVHVPFLLKRRRWQVPSQSTVP